MARFFYSKSNGRQVQCPMPRADYNYFLKLSGNILTLGRSEEPIRANFYDYTFVDIEDDQKDSFSYSKEDLLYRSVTRARTKIRDLINCNIYGNKVHPKFLTLTFKDTDKFNIEDLKQVNLEIKKFIQRLNYFVFGVKKSLLKYVGVPELHLHGERSKQGKKVWHYHLVFFNLPYQEDLNKFNEIWGLGYCELSSFFSTKGKKKKVKIQPDGTWEVDGTIIKDVGSYISKVLDYVTKNLDDESINDLGHNKNQNFYIRSRNLKDPLKMALYPKDWINLYNDIENCFELLSDQTSDIQNDFLGSIHYRNIVIPPRNLKFLKEYLYNTIPDFINQYKE